MSGLSVESAVARYVADLEDRQCSVAHVRTVRYRLGRFARGREEVPLRVAADELAAHFAELRESGLSNGSMAGFKQTHLAFWRWCAARRWCSRSVTDVLRGRRNSFSFRPVVSRAANLADFEAVVQALPSFAAHRGWWPRDVRDAALVSVIVDSARRRGEVLNLRRAALVEALARADVLANGRLVYHAVSEGKTGPVSIRFYEESADLLRRWLGHLPAGSNWVFVSLRSGNRLRGDSLRIGLERICGYAGVPAFGFHAIRKRVVTEVISTTGDAKIGQLLAGHRSIQTTQVYYNDVNETAVDLVAAALADRVRGAGEGLAGAFFGMR